MVQREEILSPGHASAQTSTADKLPACLPTYAIPTRHTHLVGTASYYHTAVRPQGAAAADAAAGGVAAVASGFYMFLEPTEPV